MRRTRAGRSPPAPPPPSARKYACEQQTSEPPRLCGGRNQEDGMSRNTIVRMVGAALAVAVALSIILALDSDHRWGLSLGLIIGITAASALVAFLITPYVIIAPYRWVLYMIRHTEVSDLVAGALGLIVGLLMAALASIFLSQIQFLRLGQ